MNSKQGSKYWISQPWDQSGMFFCHPDKSGFTSRKWTDPLISTHLILFIAFFLLLQKGHTVQAFAILLTAMVSLTYHKNVETCYGSFDVAMSLLTSATVFLTAYMYGSRYVFLILFLSILSIGAWWYAAKEYIHPEDTENRCVFPGNHPDYCSLHTLFHIFSFSSVLFLCIFILPSSCPEKKILFGPPRK
jgi:hypothetical protein